MSTLINLCKAFAGESQARNRYLIYSKAAAKEGLDVIAKLFVETADQEGTHARLLFEMIQSLKKEGQETPKIEAEVPIDFGDTATNLMAAIAGETYEHTIMYPEFAKVAKEEGHTLIATKLNLITRAEENHHARYQKILDELKANNLYKKDSKVFWVCRECGFIFEGTQAPKNCPLCGMPGDYFRIKVDI
ncbi:hypothetical protein EIN_296480 [Entamoeba invadens IP1]|uniref:Rubrerythrin n=2 Tax=Entamoeba invadens TaxID=33085 RepID=L7FKE4_ENTIV|nr:hypothetical protein EIN_296480 [Entamoeba invadens IP1]ELP86338.1 hypothetical protein EIN_296480 [Entamoeba invadens IP1]BAN42304.1 hypothetical protein, conserved [Entamoeba invadens]|eukprot:XP_004185684.1 hypothetical protein EIN_296480 [Entamoeba invadens IP1]